MIFSKSAFSNNILQQIEYLGIRQTPVISDQLYQQLEHAKVRKFIDICLEMPYGQDTINFSNPVRRRAVDTICRVLPDITVVERRVTIDELACMDTINDSSAILLGYGEACKLVGFLSLTKTTCLTSGLKPNHEHIVKALSAAINSSANNGVTLLSATLPQVWQVISDTFKEFISKLNCIFGNKRIPGPHIILWYAKLLRYVYTRAIVCDGQIERCYEMYGEKDTTLVDIAAFSELFTALQDWYYYYIGYMYDGVNVDEALNLADYKVLMSVLRPMCETETEITQIYGTIRKSGDLQKSLTASVRDWKRDF